MSTKYKESKDVPISVLCLRLNELSEAITKGQKSVNREFVMRVPAELDCDADLVIGEAARRLKQPEVIFKSDCSSLWYENPLAAGDYSTVKIAGRTFELVE
jgi:hypothetical protein